MPHPSGQAGEDAGPQEAEGESESLCQAVLGPVVPNFHLLVKEQFLMGVLSSDANFWEGGQGPSSLSWHQGGRDCLALE